MDGTVASTSLRGGHIKGRGEWPSAVALGPGCNKHSFAVKNLANFEVPGYAYLGKGKVDSSPTEVKRLPYSNVVIDFDSDKSSPTNSPEESEEEEVKVLEKVDKPSKRKVVLRSAALCSKDGTKKAQMQGKKAYGVFCGKAELIRKLRNAGFDALGIDYKGNKDKPVAQVLILDINADWGREEVERKIFAAQVVVLTFASPCGTAARCREIRRKEGPDPKPVRSDAEPDCLSKLDDQGMEDDKERVLKANSLYQWVTEVVIKLKGTRVLWVIENLANSLMWKTSFFRKLLFVMSGHLKWAHMEMCMHGGKRNKKTSLLYGGDWSLEPMELMCDKNHEHEPWGLLKGPGSGFATGPERNYPELFCERTVKQAQVATGVAPQKKEETKDEVHKVAAGKQPRRGKNDLLKEFKSVCPFFGVDEAEVKNWAPGKDVWPFKSLPKGTKLLDVSVEQGESGSSKDKCKGFIGYPWSPDEFLEQSKKVIHPFDDQVVVPQRIAQIIHDAAVKGKDWVKNKRSSNLKWYTMRLKEFEVEEERVHSQMNPDVEKVVKEKKISLFKEMLNDILYDDLEVVDVIKMGVKIVGHLKRLGIWEESEDKRPKCTMENLWAGAREAQESVLKPRCSVDRDMDDEVWRGTLDEVIEGSLVGPLTRSQLEDILGKRKPRTSDP